jgi:dihydrofolate synthase/folylpolyglutamate synthase
LRQAGYRTGLYTSPHLVNFRERIRVDGEMISREDLAAGISRLRDAVRDWDHAPTFFEISTVLALDYFARSGCDLVVLETGMGGRLDSTNAVTPLVSTITPIDMDHMQWLGDTLPKIAAEKAGIIKTGVPVVSAPQQPAAAEVLGKTAAERGSEIRFVSEPCLHPLALAGAHQKWNAALAVETLRASGLGISDAAIREGLLRTEWPARFQRVGERFVVDGAHNAHSADALVETWREVFADRFIFVPVENPRSESPATLFPLVHCSSQIHLSLEPALRAALDFSEPVLVTGSLFLAGEALRIFERNPALRACDASALR